MSLPFDRISCNIQRGSVRRQGVVLRDNEHHLSNLRPEQETKLFIHFFDVSKVICLIIQQLKGCIVWLPTALDLKVSSGGQFQPALVIKALTIKEFEKHQNHTPCQYTRKLSRF